MRGPDQVHPDTLRSRTQRKAPPLVSPEVARDFIFVEDVCEASITQRIWDTSIGVADSRKITHELGWKPGHTF